MNHNNVQRYYTITLLLSALPVSTMSAPGTPDSEAAPGYMAAQQDPSPVPVHHHAVIPAPSTPVLPVHQNAGLPIVNTDLTLRRASLGTPFYAEADAGLRDGPLEEPKGLLCYILGLIAGLTPRVASSAILASLFVLNSVYFGIGSTRSIRIV